MQEVLDERVHVLEIPEGLVDFRRAQLCNCQLRIRIPESITNIVSAELVESFEGGIVNGGSTAEQRIDNCLQGRSRAVGYLLLPLHNYRRCTRRALRGQDTARGQHEQREDHNDSISFRFFMHWLRMRVNKHSLLRQR